MRRNRILAGNRKNVFYKHEEKRFTDTFQIPNEDKRTHKERTPAQEVLRCIRRKKPEPDQTNAEPTNPEPKHLKPRVVFNSDCDANAFKVMLEDDEFQSKYSKDDKSNVKEEQSEIND